MTKRNKKKQAVAPQEAQEVLIDDTSGVGVDEAVFDAREENLAPKAVRRTRVLKKTEDGRITDVADVPVWTRNLYEATGATVGTVFFALFLIVFWPALIAVITALSIAVITFGVTTLPGVVARTLGVPVGVLVSSMDAFVFSWVLPVFTIAVIFAVVYGWVIIQVLRWGASLTDRMKRGFVTGHGESAKENRQRRKRAKIECASIKAHKNNG